MIKEIYALTQDDVGSCRMKGECCWTASIRLLAYVDVKTAELKQEKRMLQWMLGVTGKIKNRERCFGLEKGNDLSFNGAGIPAEKTIWSGQEMPAGAWLLLVDVLERDVRQPQLQELLTGISEACLFISVRYLSAAAEPFPVIMFQGRGMWNAQKAEISLDTDEHDDKHADEAL
ncbi:MAG: DUF7021 domain-containing protein [[Clostridium] innocuum]